jgi:hypothetical protein
MMAWFRALPEKDPRKAHKHYNWSDERGLYFADNFAGPDDGRASRPRHDIFHPVTGKSCKKPSTGWRWDQDTTDRALSENPPRIHFGPDETTIPNRKSYLHEIDSEPFFSVFYRDGRAATLEVENLLGKSIFPFPKNTDVIGELIQLTTKNGDVVLDFFAGSGTTAEAVMRLNAEDGGQRQFILVQIPQPIDATKQKEAHDFVTKTLKRPAATIFEITAERIRRAGAKLQAEQAAKRQAQGELLADDTPPLDTGFRVFELVDDPLGLVHMQPLKDASQAQVQDLQQRLATPQTADMQQVLSNLLLAEGLPLTTRIQTVVPETLFLAEDVALLLQALPQEELQQHLQSLQAAGTVLHYLTVYAPWVQDDNLLLGLESLWDKLGWGEEKLRLRG